MTACSQTQLEGIPSLRLKQLTEPAGDEGNEINTGNTKAGSGPVTQICSPVRALQKSGILKLLRQSVLRIFSLKAQALCPHTLEGP